MGHFQSSVYNAVTLSHTRLPLNFPLQPQLEDDSINSLPH